MTGASCSTCRFADPTVEDEAPAVLCRRYPPTVLNGNDGEHAAIAFPEVQAEDWCGEWQAP